MNKKLLTKIILISFCFILSNCNAAYLPSPVAMLSVSSDGKYILSTHYGRYLILWDLENHSSSILNQHTNIHSPYFIKGGHHFLWQDADNNDVHLQTVEGHSLRTFNPGFPVYGHVMSSDEEAYIASADDWSLYHLENNQVTAFKKNIKDYSGSARLLGLSLEKNYLLTSGDTSFKKEKLPIGIGLTAREVNPNIAPHVDYSLLDGIALWDAKTGKPQKKFFGTMSKTMSTISPDSNYVVAVDEGLGLYVWEMHSGKRLYIMDVPTSPDTSYCHSAGCIKELEEKIKKTKVIPDDFYEHPFANDARSVAVKFIDEDGHLIRFINSVNYATLYHVDSPKVQAYMDFGKNPQPHVFSVFRSANLIDTAPKAKILAMGQSGVGTNNKNKTTGIIVYRFDDKTQTLKRLWAPQGPPPHKRIINPEDKREY